MEPYNRRGFITQALDGFISQAPAEQAFAVVRRKCEPIEQGTIDPISLLQRC